MTYYKLHFCFVIPVGEIAQGVEHAYDIGGCLFNTRCWHLVANGTIYSVSGLSNSELQAIPDLVVDFSYQIKHQMDLQEVHPKESFQLVPE